MRQIDYNDPLNIETWIDDYAKLKLSAKQFANLLNDCVGGPELASKYSKRIKDAEKYRAETALVNCRKYLTSVWIRGDKSGSGKSTLAKYLAYKYGFKNDTYFAAAGEHRFDNYNLEACSIIDDYRGTKTSGLLFEDFLKLTDPYNRDSEVAARYFNKNLKNCELMIFTSMQGLTKKTEDDLSCLYPGVSEDRSQLYRRFDYQYFDTGNGISNIYLVKINENGQEIDRQLFITREELNKFQKELNSEFSNTKIVFATKEPTKADLLVGKAIF